MATATRITPRSASASITAAIQHLALRVDESVESLRSDITWISDGPRRSLEVDLSELEDRHAATVLALIAATTNRARALGNEVRVVNLPEHLRRDARGFGLRSA